MNKSNEEQTKDNNKINNKINENINENISESSLVNDIFMEDIYKDNYIDLYKLEGLDVKDQSKVFSLLLTNIYRNYNDIDYGNIRELAMKCLKLSCDPENNTIELPYKLVVTKDNNRMYFKFDKEKKLILFITIIGLFVLFAIVSTYFGLKYLSTEHLNIDINGDGIADLNIDTSGNDKADINISYDRKKPIMNIDYKGNKKPIFNVDTNDSGEADFNLINQDLDNDGICDLNCDTNDDGWPDINIDIDGDGIADLFIDTNNDGKPNLNFDMNGDNKCDLHCDTNGDYICDTSCINNVGVVEEITGGSYVAGNNGTEIETANFIIDFVDSNLIVINDLFPENQPLEEVNKYFTKKISIENKSPLYVMYGIELIVDKNTFTSDNFVFSVKSTNKGYESDFVTVPNVTSNITGKVVIPPKSFQEYEITFKLRGIDGDQNYDQGKQFAGTMHVKLYED